MVEEKQVEETKEVVEAITKEDIANIEKEIEEDSSKKLQEAKEEISEEVSKKVIDEMDKTEQIKELKKQVDEINKSKEELSKEVEETKKKLEELPAQRKGIVNNQNPLGKPEEKVAPTFEDLGRVVDESAVDKVAAIKKTLGL
jgi:chromosome segregation ATPase